MLKEKLQLRIKNPWKYEFSSIQNSNCRKSNPKLRVHSKDTKWKSKICSELVKKHDNKENNFVLVFIVSFERILHTVLAS